MSELTTTETRSVLSRSDLHALMQKAHTALSRIEERKATAKADHERIDQWLDDENASDEQLVAYVEAQATVWLSEYLSAADAAGETVKRSVMTPWGRVKSIRKQPAPTIETKDELMSWARVHGYLRTKISEDVDWAEMKKRLTPAPDGRVFLDGEEVPGVTMSDGYTSIEVEWHG